MSKPVSFYSEGVKLAGDLFLPGADVKQGRGRPAVVLFEMLSGRRSGEMAPSSLEASGRWSIDVQSFDDLSILLLSSRQDDHCVIEMVAFESLVAGIVQGIERHRLKKLDRARRSSSVIDALA